MVPTFKTVTRVIFNKNQFSRDRNEAKPAAFIPRFNPETEKLELSVIGTDNLNDEDIWKLGKIYVVPPDRHTKGRADLQSNSIRDQSLTLIFDDHIEGRHANILNWPETPEDQYEIALELVRVSKFVHFDSRNS